MGTVGRTRTPGFFVGNTADSVPRQVNFSVLAIKPEGFSNTGYMNNLFLVIDSFGRGTGSI